jgi:hypothetical protein
MKGRRERNAIHEAAETAGVFGVPSFVIDGELSWGREHLPDIRNTLAPFARAAGRRISRLRQFLVVVPWCSAAHARARTAAGRFSPATMMVADH